jgi:RNA polymerase sigma-70 factor (ECF subfamily)
LLACTSDGFASFGHFIFLWRFLVAIPASSGTYHWPYPQSAKTRVGCAVQSDAELFEQAQSGDVDAFAVLVRRYERLVRATALRAVCDRHTVEDVIQNTFLAVFQSLESLRDASKFGPWLLAIARNQAARQVRQIVRQEACITELAASRPSTNGKLTEQSERLLELVDRLPDHERIIIGLRHFEGYTVQEVATITARPLGTVTKQLSRAHKRLQHWLQMEVRR